MGRGRRTGILKTGPRSAAWAGNGREAHLNEAALPSASATDASHVMLDAVTAMRTDLRKARVTQPPRLVSQIRFNTH